MSSPRPRPLSRRGHGVQGSSVGQAVSPARPASSLSIPGGLSPRRMGPPSPATAGRAGTWQRSQKPPRCPLSLLQQPVLSPFAGCSSVCRDAGQSLSPG